MIRFDQVSVRFGDVKAVDGVTLDIPKGTVTALIGPSGCGKSTLLRTVLNLVEPSAGRVHFDGKPVTAENAREVRHRTGYVIQSGGLFPHLTAEQNCLLPWQEQGRGRSEGAARVEELASLAQLPTDALSRYPSQLSGGQQQRVALMRGLMMDPDLLLLDEPLSALDPLVRAQMQSDLRSAFVEFGKTVLVVTHDMPEAGHLAEHIVLMRDGKVVQEGTIPELIDEPAEPFVNEFVTAQRSLGEM